MTLTLELTPAEEIRLRRESQQHGQEMTEYARAVLLPNDETDTPAPGESVFDSMKDYIGLFSGGEQTCYSEKTGEKFADALLEKKQQSRL